MFAVATATSGLALVTEIDLGYFDKLLVAPIRRSSIIFGRLTADLVRGIAASTLVLLVGIALGARIESGSCRRDRDRDARGRFGVAYAGFGLLVALRTRNVQATQSSFLLFFPLLFLTPNFVPFDRLSPLMETLARINPVSYVIVGMRGLVIDGWNLGQIAVGRARDHWAGRDSHRVVAPRDRQLRPLSGRRSAADTGSTGVHAGCCGSAGSSAVSTSASAMWS